MGFIHTYVEVDDRYPELRAELKVATPDSHPHIYAMCDNLEELIERVLPKHGYWYEVPEDQRQYILTAEYVIWYYEGIVYKGKYRLFIELHS